MAFEAKYGGICGSCTERIHVGDLVMYIDHEVVHADCEEVIPVERKTVTCETCWLIKPCDCEVA